MAYTSVGQSPTSQIDIAKSLFAPGVVDNMAGQKYLMRKMSSHTEE